MCQVFGFELADDIARFFRRSNGLKEQTRKLSAVMKVLSLTIIRSSADKEKINFCRRWQLTVNVLIGRKLWQSEREITLSTFPAHKISEGSHRMPVTPEITNVQPRKKQQTGKQIGRLLDPQVDTKNTKSNQRNKGRNNEQYVTNS